MDKLATIKGWCCGEDLRAAFNAHCALLGLPGAANAIQPHHAFFAAGPEALAITIPALAGELGRVSKRRLGVPVEGDDRGNYMVECQPTIWLIYAGLSRSDLVLRAGDYADAIEAAALEVIGAKAMAAAGTFGAQSELDVEGQPWGPSEVDLGWLLPVRFELMIPIANVTT